MRTTGDGTLPLVGCRIVTLREAARRPPFEDLALLIAAHSESGRVYAARAFAPSTEASDPPPAPPDPGEGYSGSSFRIDVAARLGLRLEPGAYTVWLIVRDEASGPVRIQVVKPAPPPSDDPEVIKFIAAWRERNLPKPRGADPASVWPREAVFGSYPSYRSSAESPPLPERGIVLRAKRVLVLEQGARWVLAGSFRLALARRHVVLKPVSGDATTAVVPITIVMTSSEQAGPLVWHLRVPSTSKIESGDDAPVVAGHFTLNLFSLPRNWRAPGTYFVYAVCGDAIADAATTALVSESMLSMEG